MLETWHNRRWSHELWRSGFLVKSDYSSLAERTQFQRQTRSADTAHRREWQSMTTKQLFCSMKTMNPRRGHEKIVFFLSKANIYCSRLAEKIKKTFNSSWIISYATTSNIQLNDSECISFVGSLWISVDEFRRKSLAGHRYHFKNILLSSRSYRLRTSHHRSAIEYYVLQPFRLNNRGLNSNETLPDFFQRENRGR